MTAAFTAQRVATIREIIAEHLDVDAADLTEHSRFRDDHGADSLRLMDVLAALETEFGIEIDESRLEEMVDLRGVCEIVFELAGK